MWLLISGIGVSVDGSVELLDDVDTSVDVTDCIRPISSLEVSNNCAEAVVTAADIVWGFVEVEDDNEDTLFNTSETSERKSDALLDAWIVPVGNGDSDELSDTVGPSDDIKMDVLDAIVDIVS